MNSATILLVDDEEDVLWMLQKRLIAEGYSVMTARDGQAAIRQIKRCRPDLIILDEVMPGMTGGEVAESLKTNDDYQDIPIIFLTALLSKEEEYEKNNRVAKNITFAKPVDTQKLLKQMKALLSDAYISTGCSSS